MKELLLIILLLPLYCVAQSKISGTVNYLYNDFQGNKADVGAGIYIIDSTIKKGINFNAIDSIIEGEHWYISYHKYQKLVDEQREKLKYMSKRKRKSYKVSALQDLVPDFIITQAKRYGVETKKGYDLLDSNAMYSSYGFRKNFDYSSKADGVGNYTIQVKKPGTYYVLIQSANRSGNGLNTLLGNLYLEKVQINDGDEKNVSTTFKIY